MSLQVNLSSREISDAYQNVINARGIDWVIFTYEGGTNDLKVQASGHGGLGELEEEFSDGRMQYAFARVVDRNSNLPKFVQINWCGDGVPEAKKGLFHTHSNSVAKFLRGAHVVISARNESDVTPALIMSRVEAASGAKYSSHKEQPRKFEPIAPVGSSYTPVGKVDISALKKAPPPAARPAFSALPAKPTFGSSKPASSAGSLYGRTVVTGSAPADAWPEEAPKATAPPKLPTASRPPVLPTTSRPAFSAMQPASPASISTPPARVSPAFTASQPSPPPRIITHAAVSSTTPSKPEEQDKIEPTKSAYTPVSLPTPKKLKNPFSAFGQQSASTPSPSSPSAGGAKKLTWSERQALAKKQQEEEEVRSRSAAYVAPAASPVSKPVFPSSAPTFGRATVSRGPQKTLGDFPQLVV